MMSCLCGDRGIGKTHQLSSEIVKRKKSGFFVITNMRHDLADIDSTVVKIRNFQDLFNLLKEVLIFKNSGNEPVDLNPRYRHSGMFIAIDEAHLYLSSESWRYYKKQDENESVMNFLSQARKIDVECMLTVQHPSRLDKPWRMYTEEFYQFKALFPLKYFKKIKHPTKDCFSREMRYLIPVARRIQHSLKPESPYFTNLPTDDVSGFGTIVRSRFVLFGYLNSYPYTLYNSKELIGVSVPDSLDFPILTKYKKDIVLPNIKRHFPTLIKLLNKFKMVKKGAFAPLDTPKKSTKTNKKTDISVQKKHNKKHKFIVSS